VRGPAVAALVLLTGLAAPASAGACSCVALAPETRFELADGAVIAKLIEVDPRGPRSAVLRYRVQEAFKARRRLRRGRILALGSTRDGASCGLPEQPGRRYGLFLGRFDGRWRASLCDVVAPSQMRDAAAGGGPPPTARCGD
jgi:hypothetical protein